jgi:hypothetical protein
MADVYRLPENTSALLAPHLLRWLDRVLSAGKLDEIFADQR